MFRSTTLFFPIFFTCFFISQISTASELNICESIQDQARVSKIKLIFQSFRPAFSYYFKPGNLVKPNILTVNTTSKSIGSYSEEDGNIDQQIKLASRNLIFSLAPPQEDNNFQLTPQKINQLHELEKQYDFELKKLKKIVKTKSIPECEQRMEELNFDEVKFRNLQKELNQQSLPFNAAKEAKLALKRFSKAQKQLRLDWEYIPVTTVEAVSSALRDRSVRNIVIINHGIASGRIVDSFFDVLPPSIFQDISPSLQSLSLFSCYNQKSVEYYKLEKIFSSRPSHFDQRFIVSTQLSPAFNNENVVPLRGFKQFIRKIDKFLFENQEVSEFKNQVDLPPMCTVSINNFGIKSGRVYIELDHFFVGIATKETSKFQIPCNRLNKGKHYFYIANSNLLESARVENSQPYIEIEQLFFTSEEVRIYRMDNGDFRSSKIFFEIL